MNKVSDISYMSHLPENVSDASLAFFRKKFPYRSEKNYTAEEYALLKKKYKPWKVITVVIAIAMLCILPAPIAWLCYKIYHLAYTLSIGSGQIFYAGNMLQFLITSIFLGVATLIWWVEWIQRIILTYRYDEFEDFYNNEQEYDNHKASVWFGKIAWYIALFTMPFSFGARTIMHPDHIFIKKPLDIIGKNYSFDKVLSITRYDSTQNQYKITHVSLHYDIQMSDGNIIRTNNAFADKHTGHAFAEDLSKRSGISIISLAVDSLKK